MANVKRKLHFVEVKFDDGGNGIPQKRPKQDFRQKIGEIRPAALLAPFQPQAA